MGHRVDYSASQLSDRRGPLSYHRLQLCHFPLPRCGNSHGKSGEHAFGRIDWGYKLYSLIIRVFLDRMPGLLGIKVCYNV